jgi:hypothetical protein
MNQKDTIIALALSIRSNVGNTYHLHTTIPATILTRIRISTAANEVNCVGWASASKKGATAWTTHIRGHIEHHFDSFHNKDFAKPQHDSMNLV